MLVSDAAKRGGAASVINYKAKIRNTNFEKDAIDYEGQIELKLKGGKKLVNNFSVKQGPAGDKINFELKVCLLSLPGKIALCYV